MKSTDAKALVVAKAVIETLDGMLYLTKAPGQDIVPVLKFNRPDLERVVDNRPLVAVSRRVQSSLGSVTGFDDSSDYVLVMGVPYLAGRILPPKAQEGRTQQEGVPAVMFKSGYLIKISAAVKSPLILNHAHLGKFKDDDLRKDVQWLDAVNAIPGNPGYPTNATQFPTNDLHMYELVADQFDRTRQLTIYRLSDSAYHRLAEVFQQAKGVAVMRR